MCINTLWMLDITYVMLDIPQQNPLKYGFSGIEVVLQKATTCIPITTMCSVPCSAKEDQVILYNESDHGHEMFNTHVSWTELVVATCGTSAMHR